MKRLSELKNNTVCTAAWILNLPSEVNALLDHCKIQTGSELSVIQNSRYGLIIGSGQKRLALDPQTASRIWATAPS